MPVAFQPPDAFQRDAFQCFTYPIGLFLMSARESKSVEIRLGSTPGPHYFFSLGVKKMKAGSEVYIQVKVYDMTVFPKVLIDPSAGVKITLKSLGVTTVVDLAAMTKEVVGVYSYLYQTLTTSTLGSWTGEFKIENDGHIVLTEPAQLFVLES